MSRAMLGFTGGGFLYLAMSNMIPEILKSSPKTNFWDALLEVISMAAGAYLILYFH